MIDKNTILLPFDVKDDTPYSVPGGGGQGIPPTEEESDELLRRGWSGAPEEIEPRTGWPKDVVESFGRVRDDIAATYVIDGDVWRYTDEGKVINPGGGIQGENRPYEPLWDGDWKDSPGITPLQGASKWMPPPETLVAGPPMIQEGSPLDESLGAGQDEHDYFTTTDVVNVVRSLFPNAESPSEMSDFYLELWADAALFGRTVKASPLPHPAARISLAIAAVAGRRLLSPGAKKLMRHIMARVDGIKDIATGGTAGNLGAWSDRVEMANRRLELNVRIAGSGMGFKDGVFNFDEYLRVRSSIPESDRRWFAGLFSTPVDYNTYRRGFGTAKGEKAYKKLLKDEFMKTYTPEFLAKYDINAGDLQAHHIDALLASLPLYDGVEYLSKEWYHITGTLLSKNVNPGNVAENLKYYVGRRGWPDTPHGITHAYLDEIVGPDGTKFFTKEVRENMKTLKGPYTDAKGITHSSYREYIAKEWADITLQSELIGDQAAGVFAAINADLLNLQPNDIEQIMSSIGRLQADGLVKPQLIDGRWQIGKEQMREILFDIDFTENLGQFVLEADPIGLHALRLALQSENPITAYAAIKDTLPKQLSLFSDDKVRTLAKKSRRYTNKKWDIPEEVYESPFTDPGTLDPGGKRDW